MDWALTAFPKPVNKYVAKPNNNTNVLLFMFLYQTGSAYRPFTQRYKKKRVSGCADTRFSSLYRAVRFYGTPVACQSNTAYHADMIDKCSYDLSVFL